LWREFLVAPVKLIATACGAREGRVLQLRLSARLFGRARAARVFEPSIIAQTIEATSACTSAPLQINGGGP
jgi:hypothetical protein